MLARGPNSEVELMAWALNGRTAFHRAPRRRQCFDFIQAEVAAGRPFPSTQAILDHMGWQQPQSVRDCLHTMAAFDKVITRTWTGTGWLFTLGAPPEEKQRDIA